MQICLEIVRRLPITPNNILVHVLGDLTRTFLYVPVKGINVIVITASDAIIVRLRDIY